MWKSAYNRLFLQYAEARRLCVTLNSRTEEAERKERVMTAQVKSLQASFNQVRNELADVIQHRDLILRDYEKCQQELGSANKRQDRLSVDKSYKELLIACEAAKAEAEQHRRMTFPTIIPLFCPIGGDNDLRCANALGSCAGACQRLIDNPSLVTALTPCQGDKGGYGCPGLCFNHQRPGCVRATNCDNDDLPF